MPEPTLYAWYSAEEAIAFFGSPDDAQRLCNGQWVMFPGTALCLTQIGEPPKLSHFEQASRFCWVADQPYRINHQRYSNFLPAQVLGAMAENYSIPLFVRPPSAKKFLYVGELAPSYAQQAPSQDTYGAATFKLAPALPSRIWIELGGLWLGELNFSRIDAALDRLHRPTMLLDRHEILQQVVNYWHGPIRPQDGLSDVELAGLRLPAPLRWWYRWAGKRPEIMSGQNILFTPGQKQGGPVMVDDRLFFYVENQGVYQWATLPDGDNPPVFGRYEKRDPWEAERVRLSEHLILTCLFEAIMCHAKYGASAAWLDEERLDAIVKTIAPLAIAPWHWLGTKFFARNGAFMCAAENGEDEGKKYYSVWIGAKTEHPLQFLKPIIDESWEYAAI